VSNGNVNSVLADSADPDQFHHQFGTGFTPELVAPSLQDHLDSIQRTQVLRAERSAASPSGSGHCETDPH
jgi:hypothetical protein